ncbi:MAG: SpvB/TcaC N-terminal domain-containing protein [Bacteroidota bacterium]
MAESSKDANGSSKISVQEISLPKGGGAIKGMGDSFQPNFFSGTGNYSIPLAVTPARGLEPQLAVNYNSGSGNGPFGLGFSLSLSKISITTNKHIPQYNGKDIYSLAGSGQLIVKQNTVDFKNPRVETDNGNTFTVTTYLPRIESAYSQIEQWTNTETNNSFWKVLTTNNTTTFYGRSTDSCIFNPANNSQVFEWLIDETNDSLGNKIVYAYKSENDTNVPSTVYEVNRSFTANKYIQSIKYGNYMDTQSNEQFAFEVIFDYGEYDLSKPQTACTPTREWACRPDPFSVYNSGFEIRTLRLCQNVLLFHCFKDELGDPCLINAISFNYTSLQNYNPVQLQSLSLLNQVITTGYRKKDDGSFSFQQMPPVELLYSCFNPPQSPEFKTLSLNNGTIPGDLNFTQFLPVDLYGEGLSGFLYSNSKTTLYLEPEGDGQYSLSGNLRSFPINSDLQNGEASLTDIDGNGQLELVVNKLNGAGYYQYNDAGQWENFRPFSTYPTNYASQDIESADFDANGKTDLLLADTNNLSIYYSQGKKGYSSLKQIPNETGFPLKKQDYRQELVTFTNIFGDGLSHRVRIRSGSVECWPCLGYGVYGERVILGNPPSFNDFDNQRLFLADIDGSGCTDLIYVYPNRIEVFLNQNGNSFSAPVRIDLPQTYTNLDQISFSDVLGNGTSCLVFTKTEPVPTHYYYNFVGEIISDDGTTMPCMKPYLLNEINNNLGTQTQITYCSSTKFYLEDKKAGNPWLTKLRFPVQVVEQTTITDQLSGTRFVNKYKYHDGYYDSTEREFCGFGYVESWDSETLEEYEESPTNPDFPTTLINSELYIPPVYTKNWYYTGACDDNGSIARYYKSSYFKEDKKAYDFPDSVFQSDIYEAGYDTLKQAYMALKGQTIRTEVYANDNSPNSLNPYTVNESNSEVILVQPLLENKYAVFTVNMRESIAYNYERNPDDPTVTQSFVLETDPLCGQPTKTCTVALPRRSNSALSIYPEQQTITTTLTWNEFINTPPSITDFRWRGIPLREQKFEVFNLDLKSNTYFSFDDLNTQASQALQTIVPYQASLTPAILQVMQLTRAQSYYWNEDLSGELPDNTYIERMLLHHQSAATFTKENITNIFGDKLTDDVIQNQGGYFFDTTTGYWYNRGLVKEYYNSPSAFYMPSGASNAFVDPSDSLFQKTVISYDTYYLAPLTITQYLDANTTNVSSSVIDYQVMQPLQLCDPNKNVSQVLFDCFRQVVVSSSFGHENGIATGGMRLYDYDGNPKEYVQRETTQDGKPITFEDILIDNPEYYLQGAASYFFYNVNAYYKPDTAGNKQPLNSVNLIRENYYHSANSMTPFSCQRLVEYTCGSGNSLEKKMLVDPGMAISRDINNKLVHDSSNKAVVEPTNNRWIVSGRTVYNNKAKPCEAYLAYYSNTPYYETQNEIVAEDLVPPPTITHYDPLGRSIRIDTPKGFFSKVEFTPWEEKQYDQDDTIKDANYYITFIANYPTNPTQQQMDEKDALDKAALFYNTPEVNVKNNIGIPFLKIQNLTDRQLIGYQEADIQGRTVKTIDARLYKSNLDTGTSYYNFINSYDMADEKPWCTNSVDAGTNMLLNNIFGNVIQSWNAKGCNTIVNYDKLQRALTTEVIIPGSNGGATISNLIESTIYGETVADGDQKNLRGQIYQRFDQSGISTHAAYSLQGAVLSATNQLTTNYKTTIDWSDVSKVELEADIYMVTSTFDALKRLLTQTTPDETVTTNTYNQAGLLNTVSLTYKDSTTQALINHIEYSANLQRLFVQYQNGVKTTYGYEDTTQRLLNLYSSRQDKTVLQDIEYVYDPAGNITRIRDNSFETVFCNNQEVEPLSDYTYNAIYQLLQASGRQHQGINQDTHINGFKQSIYSDLCPAQINDETKLENYTEYYTYDDGGNLISKQHVATSFSWTQEGAVADNSNRLKDYTYDDAGNQLSLQPNNTITLNWDYRNQLRSTGIIQRPGEADDSDYYNYNSDGMRVRKVSERYANGGLVTEISEKIYLGNYEIKRIKTVAASVETIILDRQNLRVMDDSTCIASMLCWVTDSSKREVDAPGTRSLRYQMNNNLGSVSLEADDAAKIISYEEYFPYGGTAIIAGASQQEVKLKDYRYSGKECDDTTGLYYYGARYYMSWMGRWLNPDPAGDADGLNMFAFVRGNPITFNDPNGLTREYAVSEPTRLLLYDAQASINYARQEVPYAGNVYDDVVSTFAESTARLSVSRSILTNVFNNPGENYSAFSRAASAIGAHGGACNEFSALTHSFLISYQTTQPVMRVWDPTAHHSFTLIGDPRATPSSQVVVADAWPSRFQAATLEHTRWTRTISVGNLDITTQTPLVSAQQATQNMTDFNTAYNAIPAIGQANGKLPIYDLVGAGTSTHGTAGTAGRDDARGPRGTDSYYAYYNRTLTWNGLFGNDYSTTERDSYLYHHDSASVVTGYSLYGGHWYASTNTIRSYHTGYTSTLSGGYFL